MRGVTSADLPASVTVGEEAPREGIQSEPPGIATADKVALIEQLADAGLPEICCGSFVSPKRLPQMADIDEIAATVHRRPGVRYTGLWLNERGFARARTSGLDLNATISISAVDSFAVRNTGVTREQSRALASRMVELYREAQLDPGPAYVFCAFGSNQEADVPIDDVLTCVAQLHEPWASFRLTPSAVYLCDTVGAANPLLVSRTVTAVRERWPELPLGLHLHDTRGLGLANALAGLTLGVTRFEASVGGLGGCPFAGNPAAAGNIATEDLVLLCDEMGIETGIDLERLIEAGRFAERIVGHPVPGRTTAAGSVARLRARHLTEVVI